MAADTLRAALEILVNRLLAMDPETAEALAEFEGRVIGLELAGTGLRFLFAPGKGRVHLLGDPDRAPDALVRVSPAALFRSRIARSPVEGLFQGEMEFIGDTALAQRFFRVLDRLEIDWEELLSRGLGDPVAHALGRLARAGGRQAAEAADVLRRDLAEYLTEEARVLPTRAEVAEFAADVERLRDDVDRLEARVRRLERRLEDEEAPPC